MSVFTTSTNPSATINAVIGMFALSIVIAVACTMFSLVVSNVSQFLFMSILLISVSTFLFLVNVSCLLGITYLILVFPLQVVFLLTGNYQLLVAMGITLTILPSVVAYNSITMLLPLGGFVVVTTYVIKPVLVMWLFFSEYEIAGSTNMSASVVTSSMVIIPMLSAVSTLLTSSGSMSPVVVFALSGGILLPLLVVSSLGMSYDVLVVHFIAYSTVSTLALIALSTSLLASVAMSLIVVLVCSFLLIGIPLTIPNILKLALMGTTETNDFVLIVVAYSIVALLLVEILGRVTQQSTGSHGNTPG